MPGGYKTGGGGYEHGACGNGRGWSGGVRGEGVCRVGGAQSGGCTKQRLRGYGVCGAEGARSWGCTEQRVHGCGGHEAGGAQSSGCTERGVHGAGGAREWGALSRGCVGCVVMGCAEQGVPGGGSHTVRGVWDALSKGCAKSARMGGARSWGCSDPPQPPQSGAMERSCGMDTSGPGSAAEEEEEKAPEQRPRTRSNPEGAEDRALSAQSSVGNRSEGEGEAASSEDSPQGTAAPDGTAWPGPAHPPPEVQVKTPRVNCPEKVVSAWIWGGGLSCGVRGSAVGVSPRSSAWTWLRRWLCPSWSRSMGE